MSPANQVRDLTSALARCDPPCTVHAPKNMKTRRTFGLPAAGPAFFLERFQNDLQMKRSGPKLISVSDSKHAILPCSRTEFPVLISDSEASASR